MDSAHASQRRLTITLAPGQRGTLEKIADFNNTTLAHVVRYALTEFIREHHGAQLRLEFPAEDEIDTKNYLKRGS